MTEEERVLWMNENAGKKINKNFGVEESEIVDDEPRIELVVPMIKDLNAERRI